MNGKRLPVIVMADDDEDDIILVRDALHRCHANHSFHSVLDGVDLLDYLHNRGGFADPNKAPRPDLILLDLNMPRKDGREALKEIKEDPRLRCIPVVILTTSRAEADIEQSYRCGANSFIPKPVTFESMCEVIRKFSEYWLEVVKLPCTCPEDVHI